MIYNGSACRSREFAASVRQAGLRHSRIRPCMPRTINRGAVDPVPQGTARRANLRSKAERFIPTSLVEWVYAQTFLSSAERSDIMLP